MDIVNLKEIPQIIPLLAEWHHNQWSYLNPQSTLEKRIRKLQRSLCDDLIPSTFVALESDEVLGSASMVAHDMETHMEYSPWLASVFVPPDHRRRGVGSKLVSHTMAVARDNNLDTLYLFTPNRESFYRRLGWSTLEKEPYKGVTVSIMRITLNR